MFNPHAQDFLCAKHQWIWHQTSCSIQGRNIAAAQQVSNFFNFYQPKCCFRRKNNQVSSGLHSCSWMLICSKFSLLKNHSTLNLPQIWWKKTGAKNIHLNQGPTHVAESHPIFGRVFSYSFRGSPKLQPLVIWVSGALRNSRRLVLVHHHFLLEKGWGFFTKQKHVLNDSTSRSPKVWFTPNMVNYSQLVVKSFQFVRAIYLSQSPTRKKSPGDYNGHVVFFYLQTNTKSTTFRRGKWMNSECHQLRLEIHKSMVFQDVSWKPKNCCAPNASWVSILSTASPAACRDLTNNLSQKNRWDFVDMLTPQYLHQKNHLIHDCSQQIYFEKWWQHVCPWDPWKHVKFHLKTSNFTPSHDFWPIRLVLHRVYEGPRVLRWPGFRFQHGKIWSTHLGIVNENQYNIYMCMYRHIFI